MVVNAEQINKTTTLTLPNEEEWRQAITDNHDLRFIKIIVSIPEEAHIDPKELIKNGYVKNF